jgi:hypothetical protein
MFSLLLFLKLDTPHADNYIFLECACATATFLVTTGEVGEVQRKMKKMEKGGDVEEFWWYL